jgi:hypothetical protein
VHDEPLAGVACLAGVLHPGRDGGVDRRVEVVGAQHDERVGPTELQHDLLQVATRGGGHRRSGPLRTGQRDALDARVADDLLDLLVGGVDVDVGTVREARVLEDLRQDRRGVGALGRMLEDHGVARGQVRTREAGDLVRRVVPGHDPEDHAERATAYDGPALALEQRDLLVGQELLTVVGVVGVDRRAEVHLAEGVVHRLAHLAVHRLGELLPALGVQLGDAAYELGAVGGRARATPRAVGLVGGRDRGEHLLVGVGGNLADALPGAGVGHGVLRHLGPFEA